MSIPLSSTFISIIESPKRDPEQMRLILPTEAVAYIPVPLSTVTLDWQIIPESDEARPFEHAETGEAVSPRMQKILLAAVQNGAIEEHSATAASASLSIDFQEVEMFSAARIAPHNPGESSLLLDLGASTTKMYVMNEHGAPLSAHSVKGGGVGLTKAIMAASARHFPEAEAAKRSQGLSGDEKVQRVIREHIASICAEATRVAHEYDATRERKISRAVLMGGGAHTLGIAEFAAERTGLEVVIASPFDRIEGPTILADVLHQVGALYCVAAGLALRGLRD